LTANLPTRPDYFLEDAEINRSGAATLTELPPLPGLSPAEVQALLQRMPILTLLCLDVRPGDDFAAGHVPGSINIALSGQFASWAGGILGIHSEPILIGESDAQIEEARMRLARVGIEELRGHLAGGMAAVAEGWTTGVEDGADFSAGTEPETARGKLASARRSRRASRRRMAGGSHRRSGMPGSGYISAGTARNGWEPPGCRHCKSGYRSMIACSCWSGAGHRRVINVAGGFDAWHAARLPEVAEHLAKA